MASPNTAVARLLSFLQYRNASRPISLDAARSPSDERTLHEAVAASSSDDAATARARLANVATTHNLSPDDIELLLQAYGDEENTLGDKELSQAAGLLALLQAQLRPA